MVDFNDDIRKTFVFKLDSGSKGVSSDIAIVVLWNVLASNDIIVRIASSQDRPQ